MTGLDPPRVRAQLVSTAATSGRPHRQRRRSYHRGRPRPGASPCLNNDGTTSELGPPTRVWVTSRGHPQAAQSLVDHCCTCRHPSCPTYALVDRYHRGQTLLISGAAQHGPLATRNSRQLTPMLDRREHSTSAMSDRVARSVAGSEPDDGGRLQRGVSATVSCSTVSPVWRARTGLHDLLGRRLGP